MQMKAVRTGYLIAGLALAGVGIVGVVTPALPGTVFLILSLFCFKRSSPRLENWLLTHPRFGPTLRDWEENRSIKPRTKVVAIATMWACIGVSSFFVTRAWAVALLVALAVYATWYIATRSPGSPRESDRPAVG
jgi:uncharacterized membrane protein YbaN (DUF454 family)